ncbi:FG-GAP repeat domain-containing protein [Streptomyces sp. NPDC088760]|uniref:FG-GAP repeat domain-containing protein n=1 Tax=Streptomyces sp. NPDC088760 TaxID=3365890 RepID=UPI00381C94C5
MSRFADADLLRELQGTAGGKLSARTKTASHWTGYKKITGAGDFTGDGRADLVARDTSGTVWRCDGNGKGSFGGRVKIATGWKGYGTVV